MSLGKILVVDDDKNLLELLRMRLEAADYQVSTSLTEEGAEELVREDAFDLAVIDLQLQKMDGIALMRQLHLIHPDLSVIILTAYGSIETAVEAVKSGAFTYLTKPFDPRALLIDIEKALENKKLTHEIKRLKGMLSERFDIPNIIAKSEKMREIIDHGFPGRGDRFHGLYPGGKRYGQRDHRQGHSFGQRPERPALCGPQLRGHSGNAAGERVVRL